MGKKYQPRQTFHTPLIGMHLNIIHYAILKTCLRIGRTNSNELKEEIQHFLENKKYRTRSGKTQLTHQYFGQCIQELQNAHFLLVEENRKPYYFEIVPEFKEKLYNLLYLIDQIESMQNQISEKDKKIEEPSVQFTPAKEMI